MLSIDPLPFWSLPAGSVGRAEAVALSPCGRGVAVVDAGAQTVTLYARGEPGDAYSDAATWSLSGEEAGLEYPHDVDFSPDGRWLVVANRKGRSVTGYRRLSGPALRFSARPRWKLRGRRSALGYCDGVKFVPPDGAFLAAANLAENRVTFFRRRRLSRSRFRPRPCFVLEGPAARLHHPDGLAFSPDGSLLAVTNHGAATVTLYARGGGASLFGPEPVAVLGGPSRFRCPHSVAFSTDGGHVAVSDAGGRVVSVYRRDGGGDGRSTAWSPDPVLEVEACADGPLDARADGEEGGPKGVAFGPDRFAVCSPEMGVRIHRLG